MPNPQSRKIDEEDYSKCFIGYVIGTDEDGAPRDLDVV